MRLGRYNSDLNSEQVAHALLLAFQRRIDEGFRLFIWIALPCSPWSSWQHINLTVMSAEAKQQLTAQRQKSEHMVSLLLQVLDSLPREYVSAAFEWPRGAQPWSKPFAAFTALQKRLPIVLDFDGCRYGWRMCKPWRVITDLPALSAVLDRRCRDGQQHVHEECRGAVAEESGHYTPELAQAVAAAVCSSDTLPLIVQVDVEPTSEPSSGSHDGALDVPQGTSPLE